MTPVLTYAEAHWLDLGFLTLGLLALVMQFGLGLRWGRAPLNLGLALFSMGLVAASLGLAACGGGPLLVKGGWPQVGQPVALYGLYVFWAGGGLILLGLFLALVGGLVALFGRRAVLLGGPLLLLGLGGLFVPEDWAFWLAGTGGVVLVGLVVAVLLTGEWWPWPALGALVVLVLGLGGFVNAAIQDGLQEAARTGITLEVLHPDWLLLFGVLPIFVLLAARSLDLRERPMLGAVTALLLFVAALIGAGRYSFDGDKTALILTAILASLALLVAAFFLVDLARLLRSAVLLPAHPAVVARAVPGLWRGPLAFARAVRGVEVWRPWLTLGLRCSLVVFLALALAEPRMRQQTRYMTVIFVVDRSLSIPQEFIGNRDVRAERVLRFINDAVTHHADHNEGDKTGLIVFARDAQLELAPGQVPRMNLRELPPARDPTFTNIESALKLALASFPDGTGKRIVLISDGNENRGDARRAAEEYRAQGVQIDVLPLAAGEKNEDEIVVERIEVPSQSERAAKVPLRVYLRSFNPNYVEGTLTLKRVIPGEPVNVTLPVDGNGGIVGVRVRAVPDGRGMEIADVVVPQEGPFRDDYRKLKRGQRILAVDGDSVDDPATYEANVRKKQGSPDRRKAGDKVIVTLEANTNIQVGDSPRTILLRTGLNPELFPLTLEDEDRAYSYEAEFKPTGIRKTKDGPLLKPTPLLPRDRPQNNRATAHVQARGQRRVLVLEARDPGKDAILHPELAKALEQATNAENRKFRAEFKSVDWLNGFNDLEVLKNTLGTYDCLILANVPAGAVSEGRQEVLRAATQDLGCGLVMIGGANGYGAGGWGGTPVEKALPVDCEIKSLEVEGKGGLVLVMHACEIAEGNMWEKKIAKLSLDRLSPTDEYGIVQFGFGGCNMAVPMQVVGKADNRANIYALIDKMSPGDMPSFDDSLSMARDALIAPGKDFLTRHVIVISDGDPRLNKQEEILSDFKNRKITISTVTVGGHGRGDDDENRMLEIARRTGGRAYVVKNPQQLPAIYSKESRLVSQSFIHDKEFTPTLVTVGGPTKEMKNPLFPLGGFVRTSRKNNPLVEVLIETRVADQAFPILATWQYGLGKAVAWTSDAGDKNYKKFWMRNWVEKGVYDKFWVQTIEWAMRPTDSGKLQMRTEAKDGKIFITIDAVDDQRRPDSKLRLSGVVSGPGGEASRQKLTFTQRNVGQYVAEARAEDPGSYFLEVRNTRLVKVKDADGKEREVEESIDRVPGGVTLPHSPEYSDVQTNTDLLERLRALTDGVTYADNDAALQEAVNSDAVFRPATKKVFSLLPLWWVLVTLCAIGLFLDVAARRVAFDPDEVKLAANQAWARVRGRVVPDIHDLTRRASTDHAPGGGPTTSLAPLRRHRGPQRPSAAQRRRRQSARPVRWCCPRSAGGTRGDRRRAPADRPRRRPRLCRAPGPRQETRPGRS